MTSPTYHPPSINSDFGENGQDWLDFQFESIEKKISREFEKNITECFKERKTQGNSSESKRLHELNA